MCAGSAFGSLRLPWIVGRLDAQAVAALRVSGASFESPLLAEAVTAPVQAAGAAADVLLLFSVHDVQFDAEDHCRVRARVRVAVGSRFVVPKEPGLVRDPAPGEAIQQVVDAVVGLGRVLRVAGAVPGPQIMTMHALSGIRPAIFDSRAAIALDPDATYSALNRHIDLGDRSSFEVTAWLDGGMLQVAAPFAANGDQLSATIRVAADVSQSTAHYTDLSHDAALLLSNADPLGLVDATTKRARQRGRLALVDDLSLVGGPATARVGHLNALAPDAFPCGRGACALNVGATIVPQRVATRSAGVFIGTSRYGVLWSADAVRLLVRFCWETGAFPRDITQTSGVQLQIEGVEQTAEAISVFRLETLDIVELEYDANGRRDVLYTKGSARVVPQLIRLNDGRELVAQDPNDPTFAPSDPQPWAALGGLTEEPLQASAPELLWFQRAVTLGVTTRLGRPFTEPDHAAVVTDSRLSAPAQRVALLVT